MGFHQEARRVRDLSRPMIHRRGACRWCVASYCALTRQSYSQTYARMAAKFGFGAEGELPEQRLLAALNALETERRRFLARLERFARRRIRQKLSGRRCPVPEESAALYRADYFVVGPVGPGGA